MITFSINHCCIIRQKEFSRKTESSKIEFFHGMISVVLNQSSVEIVPCFSDLRGCIDKI